jgi:RNA polymerase sigma-70 factor (ECF subfamily)
MSTVDPPQEEEELKQFLARIRGGDEDAARELLRRYEAKVRLVVRRQLPKLLRSRFDSQDFVQSIWGSFFRRIKDSPLELEDVGNLIGFLARAARNKVIDEYRRASSRKHDMRREESISESAQSRELADASETASEVAEAGEALSQLQGLLPENRRGLLELKAAGFSSAEIAVRLGLSERTVRRVIEDLRRRAGFEGVEETAS